MLFYRFLDWLKQSVSFLWIIVVAIYLMYAAGQAVYHNYQNQQQTISLKNQLQSLQLEKVRLQSLLVYYQSDSYKEKELRQDLLLQMPDEKVYALPEGNNARSLENDVLNPLPTLVKSNTHKTTNTPIWRAWYDYLIYPVGRGN
jgi:cell division protein FtsB